MTTPALLAVALLALGLLGHRFRAIRQTTLIGPWCWLVAATTCVGVAHTSWWDPATARARAIAYLAATVSLCPAIAILGAKRPQHHAWNFIVLSLWAVLALPASETLISAGGAAFQVHSAIGWFLAGLILVGSANYWFTRFFPESLVIAAGQWLMLSDQMPITRGITTAPATRAVGALLVLAAIAIAALRFLPVRARAGLSGDDRVWLDFRDLYGTLWALRLAERFNHASAQFQWPLSLTWTGFRSLDRESSPAENALGSPSSPGEVPAIRQNLENLLRRFVTSEWIAARRAEPVD